MRRTGISPDGLFGEGRSLSPFNRLFLGYKMGEVEYLMMRMVFLPRTYRNLESSLNPAEGNIIVF